MTDPAADRPAQQRRFIDHRLAWDSAEPEPQRRCGPAVFLLCPPRSGSTLLRVMLAGHPGLFAPPELERLPFTIQSASSARPAYRRSMPL